MAEEEEREVSRGERMEDVARLENSLSMGERWEDENSLSMSDKEEPKLEVKVGRLKVGWGVGCIR